MDNGPKERHTNEQKRTRHNVVYMFALHRTFEVHIYGSVSVEAHAH